MHMSKMSTRIFSFILLLKIALAIGQNKDSSVYFPTDDAYQENTQSLQVENGLVRQEIQPAVLETLRGTRIYEKHVDAIIARGITRLTVEINKLLKTQNEGGENVVFSPMSIASVLALVLLGSNGITFNQISQFWGLRSNIPDFDKKSNIMHEQFARMLDKINRTSGFTVGQEINVATAVFVQDGYPIRPIYRSTANELYHSNIINVDFSTNPQSAQTNINNWVADRTNQKIKTILNEVPSRETRVILASALYFNADWEHQFFHRITRRQPFFINGRNSETNIEVDLMANGGEFPYYKDRELGCEILGLPYKGNKSTMYIIMPFDSSRQKLHEFESKITEADVNNLVSKTEVTGTVILFPKMKIETTIDLKQTLKLLGLTSLFDPNLANLALLSPGFKAPNSQFTSIINDNNTKPVNVDEGVRTGKSNNQVPLVHNLPSMAARIGVTETIDNIRQQINEQSTDNNFENPGLYAEQVIHKVFIDITEKGTEAAASTSISLSRDGGRVNFRVDVPFCFFIRHDETNSILFWGSVVVPNPSYLKL